MHEAATVHEGLKGLITLPGFAPADGLPDPAGVAGTTAEIVHLLNRTTYGYTESELAWASANGADAWIERQLEPDTIDDREVTELLAQALPTLEWSYRELALNERDRDDGRNVPAELIAGTVLRQLLSGRQLYELMVEFWTNHFNVFLFDGPVRFMKTVDDRENIRANALGSFGDLLRANAASPAMLYYLDNYSNTVDGPNENYARELLELHTLGVDGGYTEADVKAVARCFTGWTINPRSPDLFAFDPNTHDFSAKRVLGHDIPANRGIEDGLDVLDILASHPSTARFVSTKLARRFVADDPPVSLVDALADDFATSNGDIRSVMRTLLASDEFYASAGAKFKRPGELLISALRRTGARPRGDFLRILATTLISLDHAPFFAIPPTGYPDTKEAWLATSSLLTRWNFGAALAYGDLPVPIARPDARPNDEGQTRPTPSMNRFFTVNVRPLVNGARTPVAVVEALVQRILHQLLPKTEVDALVSLAEDALTANPNRPLDAARAVLAALLASPAFQAR